eukprot:SM000179S03402  [mRNA]  locus=s179:251037:253328:+ [translate_table: standard]
MASSPARAWDDLVAGEGAEGPSVSASASEEEAHLRALAHSPSYFDDSDDDSISISISLSPPLGPPPDDLFPELGPIADPWLQLELDKELEEFVGSCSGPSSGGLPSSANGCATPPGGLESQGSGGSASESDCQEPALASSKAGDGAIVRASSGGSEALAGQGSLDKLLPLGILEALGPGGPSTARDLFAQYFKPVPAKTMRPIFSSLTDFYTEPPALTPSPLAEPPKKRLTTLASAGRKEEEPTLKTQLVDFAVAIAMGDRSRSQELMELLQLEATPWGSAAQRTTHYVIEALTVRTQGAGEARYADPQETSPEELAECQLEFATRLPYVQFAHLSANAAILDAVAGDTKVHIVDLSMWQGGQWEALLHHLARRPGGPPEIRISTVDVLDANLSHCMSSPMDYSATCKGLHQLAERLGFTSFAFNIISARLENLRPAVLDLEDGEALVVNAALRLHTLPDKSVLKASPRDIVLKALHTLKPRVVSLVEISSNHNFQFFLQRFKESTVGLSD